jgi:hypothetical protein
MPEWKLSAGEPLSLTLAADARLTETDYTDDQIWELNLGGGEPAALALQTTYGLRAHWMRLFPRFVFGDKARADPARFHTPPQVVNFYPNYLAIVFEPFEGLEVLAEYWIPESKVAAGRLKLTNRSILTLNFCLEWAALLNPIERQGGMVNAEAERSSILEGETAYLHPVVVMTGGPQAGNGPYPCLALDMELTPGNARQITWACAGMRQRSESLEVARRTLARPWEAEQARMELLNASQAVQIKTGNPEWDAALAFSQNAAFHLLMRNQLYLPHPSFVLSRRPDQGFSVRGDGSDYLFPWRGQTALESYFLASLMPGAPELAAGLVRNFLAAQEENGTIDWKPGLGGQRSRLLSQPMLAALAVQAAPFQNRISWFREVFPGLLRFFETWFQPAHDRDGDGFPEWDHPLQSGLEDSPIFDRWSPNAQGILISRLESPALAAMLLRECRSLIEMARALVESEKSAAAYARLAAASGSAASGGGAGHPQVALSAEPASQPAASPAAEALSNLCQREEQLLAALQSAWDEQTGTYRYRDFQTHLSLPGETVMQFTGPGQVSSRKRFSQPRRLIVHLKANQDSTYALNFNIYGYTPDGEVTETLPMGSFNWHGAQARATTENIFLAARRVEAEGVRDEDQVRVLTADYTQQDISLFLPLWAGAAGDEQARRMVEDQLTSRFLKDYGISVAPLDSLPQENLPGLHSAVHSALMPWNHLAGEGLLRYGYRAEAARLVSGLINAAAASLKTYHTFHACYHAENGLAAGEQGHLYGLAPLGLFLQTAGIRQIGANEILLEGFNPFPWPINVQYRKVNITCLSDKTVVTFANGQSVTIDRPGLQRVSIV